MADGPGAIGGPDGYEGPPSTSQAAADASARLNASSSSSSPASSSFTSKFSSAYPGSRKDLSRWVNFIIKDRSGRDKLAHINRLLSTPSGTDKCLMTAGYTLLMLCSALERVNVHSPTPTVSDSPSGQAHTLNSPTAKSLEIRFRNLSNLISDIRIFMRLWGLFGIAEWGVQTFESPPKDRGLRLIAKSQVIVNVFYQVLENVAYLSQHKVLKFAGSTQNKMWAWSCRFWAAHVALDFARLWRVWHLRSAKGGISGAEENEWMRQFCSNLCWAPMTLHWSLEDGGFLPPFITGALGSTAGLLSLQHAWRQTA